MNQPPEVKFAKYLVLLSLVLTPLFWTIVVPLDEKPGLGIVCIVVYTCATVWIIPFMGFFGTALLCAAVSLLVSAGRYICSMFTHRRT